MREKDFMFSHGKYPDFLIGAGTVINGLEIIEDEVCPDHIHTLIYRYAPDERIGIHG